jgi:hypothetical protein
VNEDDRADVTGLQPVLWQILFQNDDIQFFNHHVTPFVHYMDFHSFYLDIRSASIGTVAVKRES